MISYLTVRHETHANGRVAYVAIDNQKKLNSLSSAVMAQFVEALHHLSADPDLRAVVLSGAGIDVASSDGRRGLRERIGRLMLGAVEVTQ